VRELYAGPQPDPREVVRRIVQALEPQTRERMKAPAVITSLGVLLEGSRRVAEHGIANTLAGMGVGPEPGALQMAAGLRARAEELTVAGEWASRFGDIALDALGTTAMAIATLQDSGVGLLDVPLSVVESNFASFDRDGRQHEVAATFVGHDLDRVFRHFIARDVADYIGGAGVPTVGHASQLEDAAARCCREGLTSLDLTAWAGPLAQAASLEPAERVVALAPVLAAGIDAGLSVLGGASGA